MERKKNSYGQPELNVKNAYDKFDLPFLNKDSSGTVMNGEFNVTDAPDRLVGVPTGVEDIKLTDYLVYRPLPKELIIWQTIPDYHPDSLDMDAWYADIVEFCYDGVWVDGEYYNPYFMYWMNIFVFPVPILDKDGNPTTDFVTSHAAYCTVDRYFLDYCWKAEILRLNCAIMGGRGVGKSYLYNSIIDRKYRLYPKSHCIISSSNDAMTNEAWNKIETGANAIEDKHDALKYNRLTWSNKEIQAGVMVDMPDGSTKKTGHLSVLEKVAYGRSPGKTRGSRPDLQMFEEFAAFPPSHQQGSLGACMRESRGSYFVGGGIKKCTVLYSGTGGSVENDEAEGVFNDPGSNEILPVNDWGSETGFFVPTHVKRSHTWEESGTPDINKATLLVKSERDKKKGNPKAYLSLIQEFPMTVAEAFTKKGTNIFNQDKIASQRINIIQGGDNVPKPGNGFLKWDRNSAGRITGVVWDPSPFGDISILEHPHWLSGTATEEEKGKPIDDLYVSGCDSIDQGTADSAYATNNKKGSELAILVKKRMLDGAYFRATSNIYVAKYNKRSSNVRDDWDNAAKLTYYFNAKLNIEYTKIGIVSHFRSNGLYHFLKKRPTINLSNADPSKHSTLIGTTAGSNIIDHQDQKVADYVNDHYDQIWFEMVLDQLQNYNRDDRTKFDMVIAMGLCELADEDLMGSAAGVTPDPESKGLKMYGYYTDPETGYKKYGVIPDKNTEQPAMARLLQSEADRFNKSGGVRWVDMTDPGNPVYKYSDNED
mgnify:CR=1 FL=1